MTGSVRRARSIGSALLYNYSIRVPLPCMLEPINQSNTHIKTQDFRVKYKTEVEMVLQQKCRYWIEKGYCPFRQHCTFAHSQLEIRQKMHISLKYKTKPCINFTKKGFCPYGDRCHYLHLEADLEEEGKKTRSNSEQSDCSKSSASERGNKLWQRLTHNKRIELIQTLGLDYSIRTSSRLLQMLNSNESEENQSDWMFEKVVTEKPVSQKKYSL